MQHDMYTTEQVHANSDGCGFICEVLCKVLVTKINTLSFYSIDMSSDDMAGSVMVKNKNDDKQSPLITRFTCWGAYYTQHQEMHTSPPPWAPCLEELVFTTMFLCFLINCVFLHMRIHLQ